MRNFKYVTLPSKEIEPLETLHKVCVYLIRPYAIQDKVKSLK